MCSAMLFKYSIHIFLFFNLIILTEGVDKTDLKDNNAWILPRQMTHLSHQMALREDGTTMIVGKDDNPKLEILPGSTTFNTQRVFWRDWNYQFEDRANTRDIDDFAKYLLTKNVHRKLLYAGDEICNKSNVDGVRFKQTFHEPLLPEEMECYTCDRALLSADHLLSFHVIPSRVLFDANGTLIDFASRKELNSSAPSKSSRYPLFGELINKYSFAPHWTGGSNEFLPTTQILQYFGGSRTEFDEKYSNLVEERNMAWVQAPSILVRSGMLLPFYNNPNDTTLFKQAVHEYDITATTHDKLFPTSRRRKRATTAADRLKFDNSRLWRAAKRDRREVWRSFGNGKTVQCAREVNGQLVPLDVILNVDTVTFDDMSTEYFKDYEPPPIARQLPKRRKRQPAVTGNTDDILYRFTGNFYGMYEKWMSHWVPPKDEEFNLKLDVFWEPFSCCSACCCTIEMCGIYANVHKCDNIRSTKTRKGYLSVMKLNPEKPAVAGVILPKDLKEQEMRYIHLRELMNRYPYNVKGIPLHSSLLIDYRQEPHIQKLLKEFEKMRTSNNTDHDNLLKNTPGIYVQEVTCDQDEQKLDCHKLAECKGIHLEKKKKIIEPLEQQDPCDTEDELQIITISAEQNYFRMNEGDSYRFRLDASVFDTRTVKWKISQKTVPDYNVNIKCGEQRQARHPDGRDLLFTKLTVEDTNRRIEARLDNNKPLLIVLNNNKEIDKYSSNTTKVIIWGSVILGVVLLLMIFIVVVDRVRKRRIERVLQKKNKRLNDDVVEPSTTPLKGSSATTSIEPTINNNVTKTE